MSIVVEKLCFAYKSQPLLLDNISFRLEQGAFLSIAGPNGAGKTTLLNLLSGLLRPSSGSVKINDVALSLFSVRALARKTAVVRQEFVPVFDFTALQVVSMARTPYQGLLAFETEADKKAVEDAMQLTGTACFADRPLNHLSGGERQRVFIARALAQQTPILLLDEPTSFLDMKHQVVIFDLLKRLQLEHKKTIITVTHDINLAARYADTVLLIAKGGSCEFGPPPRVLTAEKIGSVFDVKTMAVEVEKRRFFFPLGESA